MVGAVGRIVVGMEGTVVATGTVVSGVVTERDTPPLGRWGENAGVSSDWLA